MNRYFEILKQYVLSGGQVSRRESRIFTLLALIAGFLLGFVGIFVGYSGFIMAYFILGGCGFAVLIPSIALSVSVLNDANRSGWWLLISFIPLIGSIILLGFVEKDGRIFTLSALIAGFLLGSVGIPVGDIGLVVLMGLGGFAVLIPSIVLSVSVLNDANRSGWWLLISFIPFIGSMILLGFMAQDSQSNENQGGCNPEEAAA